MKQHVVSNAPVSASTPTGVRMAMAQAMWGHAKTVKVVATGWCPCGFSKKRKTLSFLFFQNNKRNKKQERCPLCTISHVLFRSRHTSPATSKRMIYFAGTARPIPITYLSVGSSSEMRMTLVKTGLETGAVPRARTQLALLRPHTEVYAP
jgi:hypothetical protein